MRSSMTASRSRYFLAIIACIIASVFAANIFRQEAEVLTYGSSDNISLHNRIHDGYVHAAYSAYANKRLLLTCRYGMSGIRLLVNTPDYNATYARQCQSISDDILKTNPTDSFAWTVRALSDSILQNFDAMNHDLVMSQRAGSHEQWIAKHRNEIAEANYDQLDEKARAANEADLAVLVVSKEGVLSIARRYWNDPGFRERITRIVEQLPTPYQRRFIYWVRTEAGASQR